MHYDWNQYVPALEGATRMQHLRDLGRRKVRTTLTILGITIGIWALVVFGSMANKINALVAGGSDYYADKVVLSDNSGALGGFSSAPMSIEIVDQVREVDGVDVVFPGVMMLMDEEMPAVTMGSPPMINGGVAGADEGREQFETSIAEGRDLAAADEGSLVAVLGSDIARKYDKHPGDTIDFHDVTFEVIGVLEPTLTAPDQAAIMPLEAAQHLFLKQLPPVVQARLEASDLATTIVVFPDQGVEPETLADRIESQVPGVAAMTGKDFDEQIGSATAILNSILVGIALISLAVGGLSVINTMAMSIAERTREIGIKRAIGGSRFRIVRELVTEAALIGFIGGAIGLLLGAIVVTFANDAGRSSGTVLFDLTAWTAVTAVVFSTVLGAIAGFFPALHAARLDPVTALRYE
jgi:putative ABC transport system permease protein